MTREIMMWVLRLVSIWVLLMLGGCKLPFPGPYQGLVTDSETGEPIEAATVKAEWWCHDNPLPDGPGSFFVRSSTLTDEKGLFRLEKETRRGGLFGSSFVLKIDAEGYIPARIFALRSGDSLPPSTKAYPFSRSIAYKEFPDELDIKLAPAAPVLLKAMKSGKPRYQQTARERLTKLVGIDYKYDVDKWEKALKPGFRKPPDEAERAKVSKRECPCPQAADRSGQSREIRKRVRAFVNAAASGKIDEVKSFIERRMDPNSQNYACRTALMKAAAGSHVDLVKYLLAKGADVNAKADNCRTALMNAASRYGSSDLVELLLSHGADVNARDVDGATALMLAAMFGYTDTVRILLAKGAEVNLKDNDDETAWFKAAARDRKEIVTLLESAGANH
jgi:Ankyrin repeats (3 copies)/Ankyrin repeats (many copies)